MDNEVNKEVNKHPSPIWPSIVPLSTRVAILNGGLTKFSIWYRAHCVFRSSGLRTIQLKHEGGGVCLWTTVSQDHLVVFHPTDNPLRPESHQWNHCHLSRLQGKIARRRMRNLSLAYKSFHAPSLMCLWSMRMVSIYNGAKGNPGVDESFAKGQYCIYTERSGSADMDFPEVVSPPSTGPKSLFRVRH